MVVLTEKQRRDLHDALKEYLRSHAFDTTLKSLEQELELQVSAFLRYLISH